MNTLMMPPRARSQFLELKLAPRKQSPTGRKEQDLNFHRLPKRDPTTGKITHQYLFDKSIRLIGEKPCFLICSSYG